MIDEKILKNKNVIYCYTNLINNKKYVGQTSKTLKTRHGQHIKSSFKESATDYFSPFHCAIRKYGIENFKLEILAYCDDYSRDILEIFYINSLNTLVKNGIGYNVASGGTNANTIDGFTKEQMIEYRRKCSEKQVEAEFKNKSYVSLDWNTGEPIEYFESFVSLKNNNYNPTSVRKAIKGELTSNDGYTYKCYNWKTIESEEFYKIAKKDDIRFCFDDDELLIKFVL